MVAEQAWLAVNLLFWHENLDAVDRHRLLACGSRVNRFRVSPISRASCS